MGWLPALAVRQPFSWSCWRVPTFTRMRASSLGEPQRPGQTLEAVELPWSPQGDIHLVGAGPHVLADPVQQLGVAPHQHSRAYSLAQVAELGGEVVLVGGHAQVDAATDGGGVPAGVLAVALQHGALAGEVLGRDEGDVPPVGVAGGDGERAALAAAADPDGHPLLHRSGRAAGVLEGEPFALEAGAVVVEQAPHALDRLLQDVEPGPDRGEGDAVGVVLDLAPPRAQPHVGPSP